MPLTISHPAASVPLRRFGLALSPLIIGSMAPDFAKFATLSPKSDLGHSWFGAFWFCLPAGLIALWIFHTFIKHPVFALLPFPHQNRLTPILNRFSFKPAKQFGLILLALLLGALTHLSWDAFTHQNILTVQWIPFLNSPLFEIGGYDIRVYKLLQHGSTIVGFALLAFWYFQWFQKSPQHQVDPQFLMCAKVKIFAGLGMVGFALVAGMIFGVVCATRSPDAKFLKIFLGRSVVGFGAFLMVTLLTYCTIWNRNKRRRNSLNKMIESIAKRNTSFRVTKLK